MSKAPKKSPKDRGLGRGLSALLSDVPLMDDAPAKKAPATKKPPAAKKTKTKGVSSRTKKAMGDVRSVGVPQLTRNPAQPRLRFDKVRLNELASSLKTRGVLQPILVRPLPKSARAKADKRAEYQIVAGERRFQAALLAGIETLPVIVRELSDRDVLEIGVIENVQRANLNPMEEARAYARLSDEFGRKHEEIAKAIGKSRAYVSNAIRLTGLPRDAQDYVLEGKLSAGHARAILSADDPKALTAAILGKGLSVREAERQAKPGKRKAKPQKRAEIRKLERDLEETLGVRADITEARGGKVSLKLGFSDAEQAQAAIGKLLE
jgi:ParB family chromosome partitioning protein